MSRSKKIFPVGILFGFLLLCSFPSLSRAHPHVFIDNQMRLSFDEKGFAGIQVRWLFDEMFTSAMTLDFDDGDGFFSAAEISDIKVEAFDNLKEFNYFHLISIDGKPFPVRFVTDFHASLVGNQLVYSFFIPCHLTAADQPKTISVRVEDVTNYTSMTTQRSDVSLHPDPLQFTAELTFEPVTGFLKLLSPNAVNRVDLSYYK